MEQQRNSYINAAAFCLGVATGIVGVGLLPISVKDLIHRVRQDEDPSREELELAISILDALIHNNKPDQVDRWDSVKRSILGPRFDAMIAEDYAVN